MAYGNFKDPTRRTASDKILCDKVSDISKNLRYDGYQRVLALMVHKFFDIKTSGSGIKNDNMLTSNYQKNYTNQLLETLRKEKYAHLL